ncbi:MAG: ATP-binding protein [Candidatus Coproplasma sp.]
MNRRKKKFSSIFGAIFFFISISVVVSVAVVVLELVKSYTDDKTVISIVMLVAIIFLALVATVIDYVRRKYTVDKPVNEILTATDKITSGDFTARLQITHEYANYTEYDFIKENLNLMAAELEKTEMLHSDFISNVSHEIKTPLSIISNYASALQGDDMDGETRKKYAQTLVSASERLTALVQNILRLNKLENQQLALELTKFRLDESIAQVVISYEELIESKGIELNCDLQELEIISCPEYLDIVWHNLISNAIKFTEQGGTVGVYLKKENGKAVVTITDTGCGISKEMGERIFDKFYQGDTSHQREGNGLGLALVKKVIDVLGGQITVESQVGKGSSFTVAINA